jgi:hypothetical protein
MSRGLIWLLWAVACGVPEAPPAPVGEARVVLDTPAPGSWVAPGPLRVQGRAEGVSSVTVQGLPVTVEAGRFDTVVEVGEGVESVEVRAIPNQASSDSEIFVRNSVIAGTFGPVTPAVDNAVLLRMTQEGLDQVMVGVVSSLDLEALVSTALATANPVVTGSVLGVSYEVSLVRLDFAPPRVQGTLGDGSLDIALALDDIDAAVRIDASALGLPFSIDATATIRRLSTDLQVFASAAGGGLDVALGPVLIDVAGFSFDTGLVPGQIESAIPFVSDAVEGYLIASVREQIATFVPGIVQTIEDALALSVSTTLLDRQVDVAASFRSMTVEPGLAQVKLDLGVAISGGDPGEPPRFAGVFDLPDRPHAPPEDAPIGLSLHDDLLNRILFEAWRAGMLTLSLSSVEEPLLALLFAQLGAEDGSVEVDALLPPVAIEDNGQLRLELGELQLTILTPGGDFGERVVVRLAGWIPLQPVIENGALGVDTGKPELTLMVVESDWRASVSTTTNLIADQLPIDTLLVLLGAFKLPLPAIGALQVTTAEASRASTGVHTHVRLSLGLAEVAP